MLTYKKVNLVINISSILGAIIIAISLLVLSFIASTDSYELVESNYIYQMKILTSIIYGFLFFIPYILKVILEKIEKISQITCWIIILLSGLLLFSLLFLIFSFEEIQIWVIYNGG